MTNDPARVKQMRAHVQRYNDGEDRSEDGYDIGEVLAEDCDYLLTALAAATARAEAAEQRCRVLISAMRVVEKSRMAFQVEDAEALFHAMNDPLPRIERDASTSGDGGDS